MEEVVRSLHSALKLLNINYVIVGGIPASIWGKPRTTLDVDIVIVIPGEKIGLLLNELSNRGFRVKPTAFQKLSQFKVIKFPYSALFSVDIRIAKYEIDSQAISRAKEIKLFDIDMKIASREDTIVYKLVRFNNQDKADIENILLRNKKKLNVEYIAKSTQGLAKETKYSKILDNLSEFLSWT
ncbi:MAG: hypothetical protein HW384_494 [Dehalococcoidia bacterium]|nr:hypothetical protein [Dehalococcoidia bacterium]